MLLVFSLFTYVLFLIVYNPRDAQNHAYTAFAHHDISLKTMQWPLWTMLSV